MALLGDGTGARQGEGTETLVHEGSDGEQMDED